LDIDKFPFRGNPDSDKRIVLLFDYTCSSCRRVHGYLQRAEERFGKDNYLVVMLPTPLNPDCNRFFKEEMVDHRNACLFASMALALWTADPEKFYEFDHWMIENGTSRYPPDAELARARAEELMGEEALALALSDPGVTAKLEQVSEIWNTLKTKSGRITMPKMLWSTGSLTDGATGTEFQLFEMMEQKLGMKRVN
jgi:protein-disulfide isomerase